MDNEALSVAGQSLPDESQQGAPAHAATSQAAAPAPSQAPAPASADPKAASAPAQDPTAGGNEPQDPVAQPQEPPAKKPGIQKRIDELTRERHEAFRAAEYWRQQAEAAKAAPQQQPEKPAPKIEDFQDINAFFQARDQWVEERAVARLRQEQATQRQQSQAQQQQETAVIQFQQKAERFKASEAEVAERYPDYLEVAQSPLMQQLKTQRPDVAHAVIDSDHGAEIVYYLGKNPQTAAKLAQMAPIAAAREIGRIEQMFMQPRPQASNAPPPPRQVGNNAQVERKPEDMSFAEYRRWRMSQSGR